MATSIPPNDNELLDQEAVQWARANGYLVEDSCAGLQHLGNRQVWATHDFTTHVQGPNTIPKTGGGIYDPLECPTWRDIRNWATIATGGTPLPCNTTPQNILLLPPPEGTPFNNYNVVQWFNPNNVSPEWSVEIFRRVADVGTFQSIATIGVNGYSINQQFADISGEVLGVTYQYQLRYRWGSNAIGAFTAVYTRTAGP